MFFAPAKVNLALHVVGKRQDGYHLLDSLVFFADVGDYIFFEPSASWEIEVRGPFASILDTSPEDNICLKAARLLATRCLPSLKPCKIVLEKHLPVASGLGGGSSDAASVLLNLCRLNGLFPPAALPALALSLGADVPVCLKKTPCRVQGIGEHVEELSNLPDLYAVLINPGIPLKTASVFGQWVPPFSPLLSFSEDFYQNIRKSHNDLEKIALKIAPEISEVLNALSSQEGCWLSRMSGSGATCFGLFETQELAQRASESLSQIYPYWWIKPTQLQGNL